MTDLSFFVCVCVLQNYDELFKANDKSVGGSFYLQSKVCTNEFVVALL